MTYDAVLIVSFGGPEAREDVIPFLENVLRGRNVPRERMMQVAKHYYHFDGKSPINDQNRSLIAALRLELEKNGPHLPIYWGNRNWHPMLADTVREMKRQGVHRALAFVTSAFSSYSGCRQYLENIAQARAELGEGAPVIDKLRLFFNHPGFISASVERIQEALRQLPQGARQSAKVVHTAHSIPVAAAQNSRYRQQLEETCRLVSEQLGRGKDPLVFQSRSGPPSQPWLGPDILQHLREIGASSANPSVVINPIGFISDHMEVLYDLDTEAWALCNDIGVRMVRAATVGTHPKFMGMIRDLIIERLNGTPERQALGIFEPSPDICSPDCCVSAQPVKRSSGASATNDL